MSKSKFSIRQVRAEDAAAEGSLQSLLWNEAGTESHHAVEQESASTPEFADYAPEKELEF